MPLNRPRTRFALATTVAEICVIAVGCGTITSLPWHPARRLAASAVPAADAYMTAAFVRHDCERAAAFADTGTAGDILHDYCRDAVASDREHGGIRWHRIQGVLRRGCSPTGAPQLKGRFDCVLFHLRGPDCVERAHPQQVLVIQDRRISLFLRRARGRWLVVVQNEPADENAPNEPTVTNRPCRPSEARKAMRG